MKILLHSNRTAGEINGEFNSFFPFLKIEFIAKREAGDATGEEVDPSTLLMDISGVDKEDEIDISSSETVREVEQKFEKQHGLRIRIMRKQNGTWVSTGITDDLTLHEQNTWGREKSKPLKIKMEDRFNWGQPFTG